jgi:DHA1 family bicyclomycin/chloramphenicol resistance-like MFS transporter
VTTVVHPGDSLTPRQRLAYVLVLGALTALGPFTIDLYLPAFPAIEHEFDVSAVLIQLTISATVVGFALGQLIVGPWSDRVGRRLPLIVATSVHITTSVGIALAPNIELLFGLRILQGVGAAAASVVALAVARDLFSGYPLIRMLSRLALVSGLAPILAPVIGSQLLLLFPWRGIFAFLAVYGVVMLVSAIFFVVETLPPARRHVPGHSTTRQRYGALFNDPVFVGMVIIGAMTFSGILAYVSSSSFLFQQVYELNPQQFGLLFGANSVAVFIGVQSSARIAKIIGPQWILAAATVLMLMSATAIVVLDSANAGLVGVLVPLWLFILFCGFSFPCVQVLALARHGSEAGTAASVLGAANFGIAGLVTPIVGLFGFHDAVPMGALMMGGSIVSIVVLWAVVRPSRVPALVR